ncbi:MAG: fructose-1,6-bisphosphatase/inositol monophosphatase family enzyme [Planctomycetota bacterium]|jgi:fructose-1,6-bisphosphatase/inositol monophosphatase family enzyme
MDEYEAMNSNETSNLAASGWEARLDDLARTVRLAALRQLRGEKRPGEVRAPISKGMADVTFALDKATEDALEIWVQGVAAQESLSVFSEDRGWSHRGPDGAGGVLELPGFDHGGPRLVIDPVDGTRNLMADLRSAWTVIALCGPGSGQPRMSDVQLGLIGELPDSRAARFRILSASLGAGARIEERDVESDEVCSSAELCVDDDQRVEHGYFSIFRYSPIQRPLLAQLEAGFFARLEEHEGADTHYCYDDQYISNGGQLALLCLGTYRFIADLRADFARFVTGDCTTSKPYDSAGAILVAREAGCVLRDANGDQLDFPLDGKTPVSFVGYANEASARRMGPHLAAARTQIIST